MVDGGNVKAFEKELELREAHNGVGTNTEWDIHERDGRSKRFGKHSSAAALLDQLKLKPPLCIGWRIFK